MARVAVVRGRLTDDDAQRVLDLWACHGALPPDEAQRRLPTVVAVLREGDAVVGVCSAYETDVALLGGRRFWHYRLRVVCLGQGGATRNRTKMVQSRVQGTLRLV